jgi:hypothetical protein
MQGDGQQTSLAFENGCRALGTYGDYARASLKFNSTTFKVIHPYFARGKHAEIGSDCGILLTHAASATVAGENASQ